jgi:hypothetical protein
MTMIQMTVGVGRGDDAGDNDDEEDDLLDGMDTDKEAGVGLYFEHIMLNTQINGGGGGGKTVMDMMQTPE